MNNEIWSILFSNMDMPIVFGCDKLVDDTNGLTLFFVCEDNKIVKIIFDKIVYSYKKTIDTVYNKTILQLQEQYQRSFYEDYWIYEIKNSSYLKWLEEESLGIYTSDKVRHFVFATYNEFIEVLSCNLPQIIVDY